LRKQGFTLTELLIVIAIIGILAMTLLWNADAVRLRTDRANAQGHGQAVLAALNTWAQGHPGDSLEATLAAGGFGGADYSGAPATMPRPSGAVDCAGAGTLGTRAWSAAPRRVGCAMYADSSAGIEIPAVLTWAEGDDTYFLNGEKQ